MGTYMIKFDAYDASGNAVNEDLTYFIGKASAAYAMNDISFRENQNGKFDELLAFTSVGVKTVEVKKKMTDPEDPGLAVPGPILDELRPFPAAFQVIHTA